MSLNENYAALHVSREVERRSTGEGRGFPVPRCLLASACAIVELASMINIRDENDALIGLGDRQFLPQ